MAHRKLKEREMTEAEKKMKLQALFQIESEYIFRCCFHLLTFALDFCLLMRERRRRINTRNFETIKVIGRGGTYASTSSPAHRR